MKKKEKIPFKQRVKNFLNYLKRPSFFIPFFITWLLFQIPIIYGLTMYWITNENKYLIIAGSWYALTAPPLPIPVIPISIAVGTGVERIINKKKKK